MLAASEDLSFFEDTVVGQIEFAIGEQDVAVQRRLGEGGLPLIGQSDETIVLTGLYLSDSAKNPRKWSFPDGTKMAPRDYLIIWADEDEDEGLGSFVLRSFRVFRSMRSLTIDLGEILSASDSLSRVLAQYDRLVRDDHYGKDGSSIGDAITIRVQLLISTTIVVGVGT